MGNNDKLSTNNIPAISDRTTVEASELAIQFLDILNFTGLMESQPAQSVIGFLRRLNGPVLDFEYVMAISG